MTGQRSILAGLRGPDDGRRPAIYLARSRTNPAATVAGWREIAKMCVYYGPEHKEVQVNLAVSALDEIRGMSDDELLVLVTQA